jgi:hypothetical protein
LEFRDSANAALGNVRSVFFADGTQALSLLATRTVGGADKSNRLNLGIDANGDNVVSVSDAGAWRSALNVIARTGGTYTGNVVLNNGAIYIDSSDITKDTPPSSNTNGKQLHLRDSSSRDVALIGPRFTTDGREGINIYTVRSVNGSNKTNDLNLWLDANGDPSVTLGAPAAWRSALNVAPIAYGSRTDLSSAVSLTTSAQNISYGTFSGVGCSANSGGIKVTEAGTYEAWGILYAYNGFTAADIVHCMLYADTTMVSDELVRMKYTGYENMHVGPIIVTLTAGQTVYLMAYNQDGERGTITGRNGSGLFVKRIA